MLKLLNLIALFASIFCHTAYAKVRFIVDGPETQYNDVMIDYNDNHRGNIPAQAPNKCEETGYTKTRCDTGMILRGQCPSSSYYYSDCCPEEYKYSTSDCHNQGKTTSTYSCAGYYACY